MTELVQDPEQEGTWIVGGVVLVGVHAATECAGESCVIHNPSDHHMRGWPLTWREDRRFFERTCPHGVAHPDPDSAEWMVRVGREDLFTHGCDGCCVPGFVEEQAEQAEKEERDGESG
jgi:hypothetical protein